ncbi:hypothetical protein SH449x_005216 [Pirellulaceae bacterium SH449]
MANQIDPRNVVGRDELIELIWRRLERNSIRFTAERRVGKTTVMSKMAAEPKEGFEVLFLELEGIDSPDRFVELLINRVQPLLSKTDQAKGWWSEFRKAIGGADIAGVIKLPSVSKIGWQETLVKTLEGVCTYQADKRILLLMDELPYMLQKIATIGSDGTQKTLALTLLDTLRSIRQQYNNVRMVYAGSVGLHHVVTDLRQKTHASEPVNDMPLVEIRALSEPNAMVLAERLLNEEGVEILEDNRITVLESIVRLTDGVPFYIEAVCFRLGEQVGPITINNIEETVLQQLTNDHDPWEMEHFRGRLAVYYKDTIVDVAGATIREESIVRAILDHLAFVNEPQSIEQVWAIVKSNFKITDREHIVELLRSLSLDHYLVCDTKKRYSFRFPLIQRWWTMAQGLCE